MYFNKIESILLNKKRKRSIKFNFIIRKLFELHKNTCYKHFNLPKSYITLKRYNTIWKEICRYLSIKYIEHESDNNEIVIE